MTQAGLGSFPLKTPGVKVVAITGSFQPNGTGAVTLPKGQGFTVARTGVGVFTVTITRSFYDFLAVDGSKITDETTNYNVVPGALTLPTGTTNGSFTLTHLVAGAAADVTASGALRRISFTCMLATSKLGNI